MTRASSMVSALLAAALFTGMAAAQAAPATRDNDINRTELTRFDNFLDDHPAVGKELRQNPALVNDPNYVAAHPELKEFLGNHPGVREEIRENPSQFMNRETRFERKGGDINRGEAGRFDEFLDSHPAIARDLRKNPSLVNNREYVENHPELGGFLRSHEEIREDLRQHPRAFIKRERQYEAHERRGGKR